EDGELRVAGEEHGDLYTLHLTTGEAVVQLPVHVILGAEPDLGEVMAGFHHFQIAPCSDLEKVLDEKPLEPHGLLEREADTVASALIHREVGDVLTIEDDPSGSG